jgi:AsmA protein
MRALKILGLAAGGLVGLVILALVAAWLFIDPNDYKDRIAAGVKSSTGRELAMPGDLKLSLFPWLALELGPATLGNPAGFDGEPFATVQHAALRVRLLPLLRRELQIGRIEIDGLDLRLQQNAAGRGNWDFSTPGDDAAATPAGTGTAPKLELAGVSVRNSRVGFEELVAGGLEVDVGEVSPGRPIALKLATSLVTAPGAAPLPLRAALDVTPDTAAQRFAIAGLALDGTLPGSDGAPAVAWKFAAPTLDLDLAAQTLAAPAFTAQYAAAQVGGSLSGARIIDAPELRGEFTLQPVDLRELLRQIGIAPPVTRDAKVLAKLAAKGRFGYANGSARTEGLDVQLDDSQLTGSFGSNLATGALTFDLALDRIDLDRYLPPPTSAAKTAKKEPFELPVDALKPLKARGQLTLGQARFSGMTLANLHVGIDANDGLTRLAPVRAQLYGGQYGGDVVVDTRPATPRLTLDQTLTGIDVAQLMNDLLQGKRLSGRGKVTMKLVAEGRNSDALVRTLNGKVTTDLEDGAVEGVDLWYAIAQAQSLLQKRQLAGGGNTGRTAFDTFHVSADVAGGVATTRDLNIASQLLRVTGEGTSNLATQAIDYDVTATVLKAPPGADESLAGLTLAAIPVRITGTFEDPKVRPDLAGLARARLRQEVDKRKDKIEEKVKDRLKGLFGR